MMAANKHDAFLESAIDDWGGNRYSQFEDARCVLDLKGLSNCAVIRADRKENPLVTDAQEMCDCIVFWIPVELIIGIIEMKSSGKDAGKIYRQIQNGWRLAARLVRSVGSWHRVNTIVLAALKKRKWDPMVVRQMDKLRVRIAKKGLKIHLMRCKTHLKNLPRQHLKK